MKNLQNSKASLVFKYFEDISNIPRGSKNERKISDYLYNFAKDLGLDVIQDEGLNIIVKKPASKGYENAPTVILQGHMDMVCEKNKDTVHDFEKDPIKLVVKGDEIYADGTTLGADDGIAVAYAMAILADNSIPHPALEVLLTTDEETGMTGARALSKDSVSGKIILNMDSEEEGYLLVSCAGGVRAESSIKLEKEALNEETLINISIKGLKGGHSGSEIDKGRGNSNKLMGRALKELMDKVNFNLVSIEGGSKDNAIPREADALIAVNSSDKETVVKFIEELNAVYKKELSATDADINIKAEEVNEDVKEKLTNSCTKRIVQLIHVYPNGISTMSGDIKDLVESSTNLGVVITNDTQVELHSAVRSSVESLKWEIVSRMNILTNLVGGKFETSAAYPGWEYRKESKIRDLCVKTYEDMYKEEPVVYAIHAGVECGLFEEKLGELDMISFGPNIRDAHTPDEHLSISSTERVWEYLLELLKRIDNNY